MSDSQRSVVEPSLGSGAPVATALAGSDVRDLNRDRRPRKTTLLRWTWIVALVPAACVAVGAWSHRWVTEDAFIDFRVVQNILGGHGPVFNVGERVEVYTSPMWVAILTAFQRLLPILPIEWWAVVLGLICTVGGFVLGARAAQRLAALAGASFAFPIGLLVACVVDGVWDFATSGLETGLVFGWVGLSWWLLVRVAESRRRSISAAFVIGLGVLVRPDLLLISLPLLGALAVIMGSKGWQGAPRPCLLCGPHRLAGLWRKWGWTFLFAFIVPVSYQVFRMAYFALIVPNTALAKSAGATWWSQGFMYLKDFVSPYWLWIPLLCLMPLMLLRLARWWRSDKRIAAAVLAAPLLGGLLSALYVVRLGGDFMHARMLLPGFFAVALVLWVEPCDWAGWRLLPIAVTLIWIPVCLIGLREPPVQVNQETKAVIPSKNGIDNERSLWEDISGSKNPITLADYVPLLQQNPSHSQTPLVYQQGNNSGVRMARLAQRGDPSLPSASQLMVFFPEDVNGPVMAIHSWAFARVIAAFPNVGFFGLAAGPNVYIFDTLSLVNPIGSHFIVHHRGRPGHEKAIGVSWMIARFTPVDTVLPPELSFLSKKVAYARVALQCNPLRAYLDAISVPLTITQALSNVFNSFSYTSMKFDASPMLAEKELCGAGG